MYNLNDSSVHLDILKRLAEEHEVWLVCKNENKPTQLSDELGIHVLRVHTGELKKVGLIRKGINTIKIEPQFKNAIKRYFCDVRFDLVLYTTPPITFSSTVKYIKKRDSAITYLMLKDIFPQNAVDLGMMQTKGIKGLFYRYFRIKEKNLYKWSDYIGCMSLANCQYILQHNPEIHNDKVGICPNATVIRNMNCNETERYRIRSNYGIPFDKTVFVYGGNLGKPQDIPFIITCLKSCKDIEKAFFLIIGSGTEFHLLDDYYKETCQTNFKLMKQLPKQEYDRLIGACDVGMIFLDHRFTIPNFPSRLLSYMSAQLPIIAATDSYSDVGKTIVDGEFGWWCESNNVSSFSEIVNTALLSDLDKMGKNAFEYLEKNYSVERAYNLIMEAFISIKKDR